MKYSIYISLVFLMILSSCRDVVEGPQGPPGRDGLDGRDGEEAYTFDYVVDFLAPDYEILIDFPNNFTTLTSDVVLVYLLWSENNGIDLWRALPQTILTQDGLFQYNYDFTIYDVSVFLDAEFPISSMGSGYLLDQVLRIVVVPGQFFNARLDIDWSDYNAVEKHFNPRKIMIDQK